MNKNDCIIRLEKKKDHREVESLIRDSFWNVYRPGCYEHYVIHRLRDDPAFVKELDLVMEKDGVIIGQNMFMKTVIETDDGRIIDVLTMGPICIAPELKRKGYGKRNVYNMVEFYEAYSSLEFKSVSERLKLHEFVQMPSAQILTASVPVDKKENGIVPSATIVQMPSAQSEYERRYLDSFPMFLTLTTFSNHLEILEGGG